MDGYEGTWWAINGAEFRRALQMVADGEDPDLVYAEFYANTEQDNAEEGDE